MKINKLYDLKITMGFLDLKKYRSLILGIDNLPEEYFIDIKEIANCIKQQIEKDNNEDDISDEVIDFYTDTLMKLHAKFGNSLSQLEFKINQVKIQAKLNFLDIDIEFSKLDEELSSLLDLNYKLSKIMKDLIYIDISSEDMKVLYQINSDIESINTINI